MGSIFSVMAAALLLLWCAAPGAAETKSATVEANGLKVFYEEEGAGPPLLLLHGGSLTHRSWQWLVPEAAKTFRVIALDSRGHGKTDNPKGEFSYELMAEDVAAVAAVLKLERPLVVGYSDGGVVALMLAIRHPDLTKAVVVAGATHRVAVDEHYFDGMESFFLTRARGQIGAAELQAIETQRPKMVERYVQFHADWKLLFTQIWPMWTTPLNIGDEDLSKITAPMLVLLADKDDFFRIEDGLALHRAVPVSELAVLPGSTHTMFRDNAPLFNSIVLDFLTRKSAAQ